MSETKDSLQDMLGDDYEDVQLLDAEELAQLTKMDLKHVYELDIPRVKLSRRRVRWRLADVKQFQEDRLSGGA